MKIGPFLDLAEKKSHFNQVKKNSELVDIQRMKKFQIRDPSSSSIGLDIWYHHSFHSLTAMMKFH